MSLDFFFLNQGINKVITIVPEGKINVWTSFYYNLSDSCQDISQQNTNVNLLVALGGEWGDYQSDLFIGDHESLYINIVLVEQSQCF